SLEAFLGSRGSPTSPQSARHRISGLTRGGFAYPAPYMLTPGQPPPGMGYLPASPHRLPATEAAERATAGTGISTRCPSATPIGLALGPDLPWADQPAPGTLGHPAQKFLTSETLLMPAFSLARRPRLGHPAASPAARRSPTRPPHTRKTPRLRRCA